MRMRFSIAISGAIIALMGALATSTPASAAPSAPSAPSAASAPDSVGTQAVVDYFVIFHTADIPSAGTDATIRIKVYGLLGETPWFRLDNPGRDDFERNGTDFFGPFRWYDVGRVDGIGVDKSGDGSEWYPEFARIFSSGQGFWDHCQMNAVYGDGPGTQWFSC